MSINLGACRQDANQLAAILPIFSVLQEFQGVDQMLFPMTIGEGRVHNDKIPDPLRLAAGETQLSVIDRRELYVECNCGHGESVRVLDLIAVLGDQVRVGFAINRMRCSRCRITFSAGP
ncbi:hypothetical protein [Pseudophaeobacter sp.]|uniref:hypothetical protein n=1 Tax=Pseudophaeobacter sp. TaxID=1971739 RepID=UPI003263BD33